MLAWISLSLSHHPSLSSITQGRSSELYPVLAQSCCIQVLAGRPTCARLCEGVHRSILIMSSSLLLQQCPACLVHLTLIVFVMGGRQPYNCYFVGCCHEGLVQYSSQHSCVIAVKPFLLHLVSVRVVHPYSSINTTAAWKNLSFILSVRFDFHMTDSLLIAVHAFVSRVLMSFSVDEMLLPRQVNQSTSFKGPPFSLEMSPL